MNNGNMQIYICDLGSCCYISLCSNNKKYIYYEFWGYINYGLNLELIWTNDQIKPYWAYFYAEQENLLKALEFREEMKILNELDCVDSDEVVKFCAKENAQKKLNSFKRTNFKGPQAITIEPFSVSNFNLDIKDSL